METCHVQTTIELLGGRYKMLILRALLFSDEPMRFGELKRAVHGVSQKTLTRNLRELAKADVLTRTAYAEVPPRVEYELTESGRALMPIFKCLGAWGVANASETVDAALRELMSVSDS